MKSYTLFVLAIILGISVRQGLSLQCYDCVGCNDEFASEGIKKEECNGSCQKIKVKDYVTRACIPLLQIDNCEEKDDIHTCWCTKDLCNGATTTKIPAVASLFVFISYFIHKYVL